MSDSPLEADWAVLRPFKQDKCLLDLPVLPEHRDDAATTDIVQEAYLKERDAIQTTDDLLNFVRRWRNVWLLRCPRDEAADLPEEVQRLVSLDFDQEKVLGWLKEAKADSLPFEDIHVRIMAHIAVPVPLLDAFQLAKHYGVGTDLGLVRLFLDGYPEHENKLR